MPFIIFYTANSCSRIREGKDKVSLLHYFTSSNCLRVKKNQLIGCYRQCEHGELNTGDTSQGTPDDDENDGDGDDDLP